MDTITSQRRSATAVHSLKKNSREQSNTIKNLFRVNSHTRTATLQQRICLSPAAPGPPGPASYRHVATPLHALALRSTLVRCESFLHREGFAASHVGSVDVNGSCAAQIAGKTCMPLMHSCDQVSRAIWLQLWPCKGACFWLAGVAWLRCLGLVLRTQR